MADRIILNRATDSNLDIVAAARAYFDAKGTSTPLTVYTDEGAGTPVTLTGPDGSGRFYIEADSEGVFIHVFTTAAVKVTVTDTNGVVLPGYPSDPHPISPAGAVGAGNITYSPTANNSSTDVQAAITANANTAAATDTFLDSGSAHQVLTMNAGGTASAWEFPVGRHLATKTASNSASLDFTELDSALYGSYVFVLSNIVPATDDVSLIARTSANAGSSYDAGASDYEWTGGQAGSSNANSNSSTTEIVLTNNGTGNNVGSAAGEYGVSGEIRLFAPELTAHTYVRGNLMFKNSVGNLINMDASGTRMATTEVNAIQFLFTSGNIESGTISMYGMRKA